MLIYVFITESYNTTFHCVPGLMSSKKTKWFDSKCMQENAEKTNWFLTIKGFRISSMQKTAGFYCSVLFFNIPQRLKATTLLFQSFKKINIFYNRKKIRYLPQLSRNQHNLDWFWTIQDHLYAIVVVFEWKLVCNYII